MGVAYKANKLISLVLSLAVSFYLLGFVTLISSQAHLESDNYKILDSTIDSGGGTSESDNYGLLSSVGNPTADARLESGSYALGSGFPNGIQANVPLIRCADTTTTNTNTDCNSFPNNDGAQGECGTPGCYDKAKVEIDPQNNPIDTLYLISVTNNTSGIEYFIQADHTLGTNYTISDYMTICEFEGVDPNDPDCDDSSDTNWDEDLQSANIYLLEGSTTYTIRVKALSGDFTETEYSPVDSFTTVEPTMILDIDIGNDSSASSVAPHIIDLGSLEPGNVKTADDLIWLDLGTNANNGINTYVEDLYEGLQKIGGTELIPSQSEDLELDGGDGGFGLKINSTTQSALGPLQRGATYNTSGMHEVGGLSTTPVLIFQTTEGGSNRGPIAGGRAGILVKALATPSIVAGLYEDTITFTVIGNF